ncbi:hypothetical protein K1719_029679 [Acacia pycnantha]|nr:hypothetical protein K1719_029679 [Acacia pycnantha]
MHYNKKGHLKILKRREKKKVLDQPDKDTSLKVQKDVPMKHPAPLPLHTTQQQKRKKEKKYATSIYTQSELRSFMSECNLHLGMIQEKGPFKFCELC